jgi:hypothetical protein
MKYLMPFAAPLCLAAAAASAQQITCAYDQSTGQQVCVTANSGNPPPQVGGGAMPSGGSGHGGSVFTGGATHQITGEATFKANCMANFADIGTKLLRARLKADKAVTTAVMQNAAISEKDLGSVCEKRCTDFAQYSDKIETAKNTPAPLDPVKRTEWKYYKDQQMPAMPGQAELGSCMPPAIIPNWCPKNGTGVGAGPSRIQNPLDKIAVCVSGGDALQNMNFPTGPEYQQCARPNIEDAAERIRAEQQCVKTLAAPKAPSPRVPGKS